MPSVDIQKVSRTDERSLPVFAEFDDLAHRIRERAFSLFNGRGCEPGCAMDDWLQAEREFRWPAAELSERNGEYELDVALAGFAPSDISITATPSELIVKASHESSSRRREKKREDAMVHWSEFSSENVYRHVELPQDVDVDHVSARLDNGLLKIMVPKMPQKKAASKESRRSGTR